MGLGDGSWLSGTRLPEARVVRHGAIEPPKQTVRRDVREFFEPGPRMTTFLSYVVGLWPLILILIISVAFLWSAGYQEP